MGSFKGYEANGVISWFDFQESKVRFNSYEKVRDKNIFLSTADSNSAVSLPDSTELSVCPMIRDALWNIAQSGSSVLIYIEEKNELTECSPYSKKFEIQENENQGNEKKWLIELVKLCEKCKFHKENESLPNSNASWIITNIALGRKNKNEK